MPSRLSDYGEYDSEFGEVKLTWTAKGPDNKEEVIRQEFINVLALAVRVESLENSQTTKESIGE